MARNCFFPCKVCSCVEVPGTWEKEALSDISKSKNLIRINKLRLDFTEVFIDVVDSYKHLGTQISFRGMAYEVSFRCGLMSAETSKLRTILRNSELNMYKNIHLIQAYLLSKGTFQCSIWAALSVAFYIEAPWVYPRYVPGCLGRVF